VLDAAPDDAALSLAQVDRDGFVKAASYRQEGAHGKRYLELRPIKDAQGDPTDALELLSIGDRETQPLPAAPVVLVESIARSHGTPGTHITLLDLENGAWIPAQLGPAGTVLDESGNPIDATVETAPDAAPPARTPPFTPTHTAGAPPVVIDLPGWHAPAPNDPVLPEHTARMPMIESASPKIASFARSHAPSMPPLEAAVALAGAARPHLDAERSSGPPSAIMGLLVGGGDEAGAALVVASLRSLGHAARVVCGVVREASGPVLGTWAEVHDDAGWHAVDPWRAGQPEVAHVPLALGFRGPLTTGRLAGHLTVAVPSQP
jgi:hypothetical protein